ncbi:uncharacterized protein B0H18DRAFT_982629 [Fomitopsis serialis]|uniref:uncharacterized protein n=1 Tax=Fomitopsis serialis TaxID=139415 RepID=UPI002008561D|nr:uncharacterized protein B0H18DRAFT_982629 [Neoantrodia serialis]KAH9933900.1 hypothetical protein B0H18DRAFT_982629 [Neoantrodia serialis]
MSYVILGRAIKSEYLAIGTLATAVGVGLLSTGGKKEAAPPSSGKSAIETVKETVKFNAGSSEEEQLMDSIKKFIDDAEKEAKH